MNTKWTRWTGWTAWTVALLLSVVGALGQAGSDLYTTPYVRTNFLHSATAAAARSALGIVTSNWSFNTTQLESPGNTLQIKSGAALTNATVSGSFTGNGAGLTNLSLNFSSTINFAQFVGTNGTKVGLISAGPHNSENGVYWGDGDLLSFDSFQLQGGDGNRMARFVVLFDPNGEQSEWSYFGTNFVADSASPYSTFEERLFAKHNFENNHWWMFPSGVTGTNTLRGSQLELAGTNVIFGPAGNMVYTDAAKTLNLGYFSANGQSAQLGIGNYNLDGSGNTFNLGQLQCGDGDLVQASSGFTAVFVEGSDHVSAGDNSLAAHAGSLTNLVLKGTFTNAAVLADFSINANISSHPFKPLFGWSHRMTNTLGQRIVYRVPIQHHHSPDFGATTLTTKLLQTDSGLLKTNYDVFYSSAGATDDTYLSQTLAAFLSPGDIFWLDDPNGIGAGGNDETSTIGDADATVNTVTIKGQ